MNQNRHNYTGNQKIDNFDKVLKVESHSPPHLGIIHVDSMDRLEFTTYSSPRFEVNSEIVRRTVNKIAISEISVHSNIPNLNSQNDVLTFETSGTAHTVNLLHGFYTSQELIDHIVTRLNTITVTTGLTFTQTLIYGNFYRIQAVGGTFKFLDCSHIKRAEPLSGLYKTDNYVISLFVNADGLYTRYIDFICSDFKESQILENLFTKDYTYSIINHLYRYEIKDGTKPFNDQLQIKNLSYSSVRNKERNIISMKLYNQFGDLLYSPVVNYNGQNINIDVFKYSLKLSISV